MRSDDERRRQTALSVRLDGRINEDLIAILWT
jgi:hypothetical protein